MFLWKPCVIFIISGFYLLFRSRSVEADRRETGQSRTRYPGLKRERSLQDIDKVALSHCLKVIEKYHEGHRDHLAGTTGAGQVAHGRHDLVNSTTDVVRAAAGLPTMEAACRSSSSTTSTSSPLQLCAKEHRDETWCDHPHLLFAFAFVFFLLLN